MVSQSHLNILFRNVNTLTHDKLLAVRASFDSDIYGFAETRQSEFRMQEYALDGYDRFIKSRPPSSRSSNRVFGGVAVFFKRSLAPGIRLISTPTPDILWIQLTYNFFGFNKDVFLAIIYFPPSASPWYKQIGFDLFDELSREIQYFSLRGSVLILGDFNAKTSISLGSQIVHAPDVNEPYLPIGNNLDGISRISKDSAAIDNFGRSLLELCTNLKLTILNGCVGTDKDLGSFTFHKEFTSDPTQESVIDYGIASIDLLGSICDFEILLNSDEISDHRPLVLHLSSGFDPIQIQSTPQQFGKKLMWNPRLKNQYQTKLVNFWVLHTFAFNLCLSDETIGFDTRVKNATALLLQSIRNSAQSKTSDHNRQKNRNSNPPWWNRCCQKLYDAYSAAVRKCRRINSLSNCTLRKSKHAEFVKYFRQQRNIYRRLMGEKLGNLSQSNPKNFWRILKPRNQPENVVHSDELFRHYKNLLQPNADISTEGALLEEVDDFISGEHTVETLDVDISVIECQKALKKLCSGKAPGLDQISVEFLKHGGPILIPFLTKLFNFIFKYGCYPQEWATAVIFSIFNQGIKMIQIITAESHFYHPLANFLKVFSKLEFVFGKM